MKIGVVNFGVFLCCITSTDVYILSACKMCQHVTTFFYVRHKSGKVADPVRMYFTAGSVQKVRLNQELAFEILLSSLITCQARFNFFCVINFKIEIVLTDYWLWWTEHETFILWLLGEGAFLLLWICIVRYKT